LIRAEVIDGGWRRYFSGAKVPQERDCLGESNDILAEASACGALPQLDVVGDEVVDCTAVQCRKKLQVDTVVRCRVRVPGFGQPVEKVSACLDWSEDVVLPGQQAMRLPPRIIPISGEVAVDCLLEVKVMTTFAGGGARRRSRARPPARWTSARAR